MCTRRGHGSSMPCPLVLSLCISSIWLLLGCILYNKIVIGVDHFLEFYVLS